MIARYIPAYTAKQIRDMMQALNDANEILATMSESEAKTHTGKTSKADDAALSRIYYASEILRYLSRCGSDSISTLVDDFFLADNRSIVKCINLIHYNPPEEKDLAKGKAPFSLYRFVYHVEQGWIFPEDEMLNKYVKQGKICSPYTEAQFMLLLEESLPKLNFNRIMYGDFGTILNMKAKTLEKPEEKGKDKSERFIALCQKIVDTVKEPSQLSKLFDKTAKDEYKIAQHVAAELLELSELRKQDDFQKNFQENFQVTFAKVFTHIQGNSKFGENLKSVLRTKFPDEYKAAELAKKSAGSPEKDEYKAAEPAKKSASSPAKKA